MIDRSLLTLIAFFVFVILLLFILYLSGVFKNVSGGNTEMVNLLRESNQWDFSYVEQTSERKFLLVSGDQHAVFTESTAPIKNTLNTDEIDEFSDNGDHYMCRGLFTNQQREVVIVKDSLFRVTAQIDFKLNTTDQYYQPENIIFGLYDVNNNLSVATVTKTVTEDEHQQLLLSHVGRLHHGNKYRLYITIDEPHMEITISNVNFLISERLV